MNPYTEKVWRDFKASQWRPFVSSSMNSHRHQRRNLGRVQVHKSMGRNGHWSLGFITTVHGKHPMRWVIPEATNVNQQRKKSPDVRPSCTEGLEWTRRQGRRGEGLHNLRAMKCTLGLGLDYCHLNTVTVVTVEPTSQSCIRQFTMYKSWE